MEDGQLLLVRRGTDPGKGLWSLPGGRVESGESIAAAVIRELGEETGLEGVCGSLVGWVERMGTDYHFVILDFVVTVLGRTRPTAGGDATQAEWCAIEDLSSVDMVPGLPEFLAEHGLIPETGPRIL